MLGSVCIVQVLMFKKTYEFRFLLTTHDSSVIWEIYYKFEVLSIENQLDCEKWLNASFQKKLNYIK